MHMVQQAVNCTLQFQSTYPKLTISHNTTTRVKIPQSQTTESYKRYNPHNSYTVPDFKSAIPQQKESRESILTKQLHLQLGQHSLYSNSFQAGQSRVQTPVEARLYRPSQPGPEARTTSCTMGTRTLSWQVNQTGCCTDHPACSYARVKYG